MPGRHLAVCIHPQGGTAVAAAAATVAIAEPGHLELPAAVASGFTGEGGLAAAGVAGKGDKGTPLSKQASQWSREAGGSQRLANVAGKGSCLRQAAGRDRRAIPCRERGR